jgi:hypothetical protein
MSSRGVWVAPKGGGHPVSGWLPNSPDFRRDYCAVQSVGGRAETDESTDGIIAGQNLVCDEHRHRAADAHRGNH